MNDRFGFAGHHIKLLTPGRELLSLRSRLDSHELSPLACRTTSRSGETAVSKRSFVMRTDQSYLELMAEWCGAHEVEVWAYCLMPNHVHLIAVPHSADGLRRAIGEVHRRYTRMVNFREGWRGASLAVGGSPRSCSMSPICSTRCPVRRA